MTRIDELEELFTDTTRHYVANSFLMIGWGIAAVALTHYDKAYLWAVLGAMLVAWLCITCRWVGRKFPRNQRTMNLYFIKGFVKYGLIGALLFHFLLSKQNGLLSLIFIILLVTYAFDVRGLAKVIAVVEKETFEKN